MIPLHDLGVRRHRFKEASELAEPVEEVGGDVVERAFLEPDEHHLDFEIGDAEIVTGHKAADNLLIDVLRPRANVVNA